MARRRRWGLPLVVTATLLIGVAGGVGTGLWLRKDAERRKAIVTLATPNAGVATPGLATPGLATPSGATPEAAPSPEPIIETVAPIKPAAVRSLSAIPVANAEALLAHMFVWSGAPDPAQEQLIALAALTQCAALRRATPTETEALMSSMRARLVESPTALRVRIAASLPIGASGELALPALVEPLRIRVSVAPDPACAERYAKTGQPQFFDLRVVGPAPWPAKHETPAMKPPIVGNLFADLVVDLGEPTPTEAPGGVTLQAQAVALYLWPDESRSTPLGAVGLVAPDSQDAPITRGVEPVLDPSQSGGALAGKPVSAELARRASQTSAVPLPPISTAPRQSVETKSLPPPLITR